MGIDIERLGPAAQKQVREELERRRRAAAAKDRQQKARDGPALRPGGSDRGSALEEEYYRAYIWPKELAGTVANVERHKKFELLPKSDYCGLRLPAAHYTPDFVIEYTNGTVEVVEVMQKIQTDVTAKANKVSTDAAKVEGYAKAAQYLIGYNKKNILTVFLYEE